jgi:purine nucleoside permease
MTEETGYTGPDEAQSLTGVVAPPEGSYVVTDEEPDPVEKAQHIAREALAVNTRRIKELRTERTGLNEQLRIDREKLNTTAKDRRAAINAEITRLDTQNNALRKMVPPEETP